MKINSDAILLEKEMYWKDHWSPLEFSSVGCAVAGWYLWSARVAAQSPFLDCGCG